MGPDKLNFFSRGMRLRRGKFCFSGDSVEMEARVRADLPLAAVLGEFGFAERGACPRLPVSRSGRSVGCGLFRPWAYRATENRRFSERA